MNHIKKISSKDNFRNMNTDKLNNEISKLNSFESVVLFQWWH
ncbi:hypothetical protein [Methanococcus voltae]|nr:hypothetical protein [Methanococcus voltae]MCS3901870.1 hypothetical protein [Methanococcus voltae]